MKYIFSLLSSLPYLIKTLCLKMPDKVYNLMSTNQSGLKMILHNYVPVKLLCHYDSLGRIQESWAIFFDRTLPLWLYLSYYCVFSSNFRNTTIDITETEITPVHNEHTRSHSSNSTKLLFHIRFYCISEAHDEVSARCAEHSAA